MSLSTTKRVYEAEHGTYEIAWGDYTNNGRRVDRYVPRDGGRPEIETPLVLDANDVTPILSTYPAQLGKTGDHIRPFSERCTLCTLGVLHSVALHDYRIRPTVAEILSE